MRSRADSNQAAIVAALRAAGCSVLSLTAVGLGCPDLVCGYRGVNYLLEIKRGQAQTRNTQVAFIARWRGTVRVVRSVDDALAAVGAVRLRGDATRFCPECGKLSPCEHAR